MQESGQCTYECNNANQSCQYRIGQHQYEWLTIMKTDTGVDPGTE